MGQLVVSGIGAIAGFAIGGFPGAQVGFLAGSIIGTILFGTSGQDIKGPRLADRNVTSSTEGKNRPIGWGVDRRGGNIIWSKKIKEKKKVTNEGGGLLGGILGGGGSSVTTYTYFWTGAVGFGEGPAVKLLRIWANGKLILDARPGHNFFKKDGVSFDFYLGTEDQAVNWTINDERANNDPPAAQAFRGECYLIFYSLPLADYGNTVPQITAEIAFTAADAYPKVSIGRTDNAQFAAAPWPYVIGGGVVHPYEVTDLTTNEVVATYSVSTSAHGGVNFAMDADGFGYYPGPTTTIIKVDPLTGVTILESASIGMIPEQVYAEDWIGGGFDPTTGQPFFKWLIVGGYNGGGAIVDRVTMDVLASAAGLGIDGGLGGQTDGIVQDIYGQFWFIGHGTLSGNGWLDQVIIRGINTGLGAITLMTETTRFSTAFDTTFPGVRLTAGNFTPTYVADDHSIVLSCTRDDHVYQVPALVKIDLATMTIVDFKTATDLGVSAIGATAMRYPASDGSIWYVSAVSGQKAMQVDAVSLALKRDVDISPFSAGGGPWLYDVQSNSLISHHGDRIYLDRASGDQTTLDVVVGDICRRCGLDASQYDVTELASDIVYGYTIASQATGSDAIGSLMLAYAFDAAEIDFKVKFVKRGGAVVATIDEDSLGANVKDRISIKRLNDIPLPMMISATYADVDRDYQEGGAVAKRIVSPVPATMRSEQPVNVTFPMVMTNEQAQRAVEIILYMAWLHRLEFETTVLPRNFRLDPTDVINIDRDGETWRTVVTKTETGLDYSQKITAVRDEQFIYESIATGGSIGDYQTQEIEPVGPTFLILADTALLTSRDVLGSGVGIHVLASGFYSGWAGAQIFRSSDGSTFSSIGFATEAGTWGRALTVLPDTDNWFSLDLDATLDVRMYSGTLATATEDDLGNGDNMLVVGHPTTGWEVIFFLNVTTNGDGSLTLSGLVRGQRGTEWFRGEHAGGEFCFLVDATVLHELLDISALNTLGWYSAVSTGETVDTDGAQSLFVSGRELKPYSPVSISGARDGSNNLTISWLRRSRFRFSVDGSSTAPLDESQERYEVDVYSADWSTVLRTITGLTSASASYSAANQTTDGLTPGDLAGVNVKVYQLSDNDTIGRGYPGEATV